MVNCSFGLLGIGNQPNGSLRTSLREHWYAKIRTFIKIYFSLSCLLPSWRNGQGGGCQEKFIRQDRATNHICEDDKVFNNTLMEKSINAKLYMKATTSPDVNLLDLAFSDPFRVSMMLHQKNKEELIQADSVVYDSYPWEKINCTRLTLQCNFNQILMHNRNNNCNVEQISKEKLEHTGQLPDVLKMVEDME